MKINKLFCIAIALAVLMISGCETIPKKFIRKKKELSHVPSAVYLQNEGEYQKQFSNEYYYKNHYTLWKSWHDDLMDNVSGNSKKARRCADEAYSHLDQMIKYLKPEKQPELKSLVDDLGRYRDKINKGSYSRAEGGAIKAELEKLRRMVANDFYYNKVKEDILPDTVDLGQ